MGGPGRCAVLPRVVAVITDVSGLATRYAYATDDVGATFGALFAVVWVLAAAYAAATLPARERVRFFAYYVPSALGGVAVAFAADAVSFYASFALMALPAWGLVTHSGSAEADRAGRVYLGVTVLGEALLLAALVLLAAEAGSTRLADMRSALPAVEHADLVFGLIAAACALKLGAIGVSGVLPLTYGHAPTGAAIALAGASTKVGVLGLVRLLPLGGAADERWGAVLVAVGLGSAFSAAALGVLTTNPKAVLGYSSASQMGLVLVAVGAGMGSFEAGALGLAAAVAYAVHHGLAKAALFAGEDVIRRSAGRGRTVAMVACSLPALALVGTPLTSGFAAKHALKEAVHASSSGLAHVAEALLPWAAVGTALVMLRFFALARAAHPHADAGRDGHPGNSVVPTAVWAVLLALVASATWLVPAEWARDAAKAALKPAYLVASVWPALLAAGVAAVVSRLVRANARLQGGIVPPGDLLLSVDRLAVRTLAPSPEAGPERPPAAVARVRVPLGAVGESSRRRLARWLAHAEARITLWQVAAGIFVATLLLIVTLAS